GAVVTDRRSSPTPPAPGSSPNCRRNLAACIRCCARRTKPNGLWRQPKGAARMIRSVAVLTCLWWLPLGAWSDTAQDQAGLMSDVTVKKVLKAETLSGCSIKFDVGYRDHTYRQGLPSVVSGDVTWYLRPMGAWASLTVTGQDISAEMEPMGD